MTQQGQGSWWAECTSQPAGPSLSRTGFSVWLGWPRVSAEDLQLSSCEQCQHFLLKAAAMFSICSADAGVCMNEWQGLHRPAAWQWWQRCIQSLWASSSLLPVSALPVSSCSFSLQRRLKLGN